FPEHRLPRRRRGGLFRRLLRETPATARSLNYPMFVLEGHQEREKIASMPGIERLSIDLLVAEVKHLYRLGIPAVALFPVTPPEAKSEFAEEAFNPNGLAQRAVRAIKDAVPEMGVI